MMMFTGPIFILLWAIQVSYGTVGSIREEFSSLVQESAMDFVKKVELISHRYLPAQETDCAAILESGRNRSGMYTVWPKSRISRGKQLNVYCDMQTDGGGWTVIQRRGNYGRPRDYFRKGWKEYQEGFGDIDREFWLGNDNIFSLTNQDLYSVRFDLQDTEEQKRYAVYDTFWIEDETRKYTLHIKGYRGTAGDAMSHVHDNLKFTTNDQDNDNSAENCALLDKGSWWYNACHTANLNGLNYKGKYESGNYDGIIWYPWKGYKESLAFTEIKIRPKDFRMSSKNNA